MKPIFKFSILLSIIISTIYSTKCFSQIELDADAWQAQMDEYTAKQADLTNQIFRLRTLIDSSKKSINSSILNVVGAFDTSLFRSKFEEAEKKASNCTNEQNAIDIENYYLNPFIENEGIDGKVKCLPEYWERYKVLKLKIEECKKTN